MPQKSCYMLVSPPPEGNNLLHFGRYDCFMVKFGDGKVREAYSVHNPCYSEAQNDHASAHKIETANHLGQKVTVWTGKCLELTFLKTVGENSEWHLVAPKAPNTYANLRKELKWLQDHFATITLDGDAAATDPGRIAARAWDDRASALFHRNCDVIW